MSKSSEEMSNIEKALSVFGQIIVDDRREIKKDITLINKSLNELLISGVEARKEREFESERNERMEGNQKEQGQEIKHNSDTILRHSGKIETLEKKQDIKDKIRIGIIIALSVVTIIAIIQSITPFIGKNNMYETPKPQNNQPVRQHQLDQYPNPGIDQMTRGLKQYSEGKK